MSKKICLVEPRHNAHYNFEYVPSGLLNIATVLVANGHNVGVYRDTDKIPPCDILGVSASMPQYKQALNLARRIDAGKRVIGGSFPTVLPAEAITGSVFDYCVVGDGEIPMLLLANGAHEKDIPGLCYKHRGVVVMNPKLDMASAQFSIPAYELWELGKRININKVRGWIFDGSTWDFRPRLKHNRPFDQEVKLLADLGVESVAVVDDVFCGGRRDISCAVRSLDRFEQWSCRSNTMAVIESGLDQRLVSSNCSLLELDVVTASDRLLEDIGGPTVKQHELALELLSTVVEVSVNVTLGIPGETVGSLERTEAWLVGKKARISTFIPFPGMSEFEVPEKYSQYGFEVTGCDYWDYLIDDYGKIDTVPWRSDVITTEQFLNFRNRLVQKYNVNRGGNETNKA